LGSFREFAICAALLSRQRHRSFGRGRIRLAAAGLEAFEREGV